MINPGQIKGTPPTAKVQRWNVSYNNGTPVVVDAITERQAIICGLELLNITSPIHPIRAWPIKEQS